VSTAKLVIVDEEVRNKFTPELMESLASPNFRDGKGPTDVVFLTPDVEAQVLDMEPMREEDTARAGLLPRDMALLIYTSGTTGLPKPAIVSLHKGWSSTCFVGNWMSMTSADRFFTVCPPPRYWKIEAQR
jgi:acyl-CoA synthetase (AMP-forming)/AMP-acid ligase II